MFRRLFGRLFNRQENAEQQFDESEFPEIDWLDPEQNHWGVPVIDVRPFTLNQISTTSNPQAAMNSISYSGDDGTGFIGVDPPVSRTITTSLRFRIDNILADGVLFVPREMEQKWVIYYHQKQIICIRSWTRQVQAVAEVSIDNDYATIHTIRGVFGAEDEDPDFTVRMLDSLLQNHALDTVYPVPLPAGLENNFQEAAVWCFSLFGNRAKVATPHSLAHEPPDRPLRTDSMLHIAVARGELDTTAVLLDSGLPFDLLAKDGLTPLHWALSQEGTEMMQLLLSRGSPVDIRTDEGATPLMLAVQGGSHEKTAYLLDRGADINASDNRGFTALHRAAEGGHTELVELLLNRGALPNPEANGHTPRSLAETRGETAIIELLDRGHGDH